MAEESYTEASWEICLLIVGMESWNDPDLLLVWLPLISLALLLPELWCSFLQQEQVESLS